MSNVRKAGEQAALEQLLAQQEEAVRAAFDTFLEDTRDPAVIEQVRQLIEANNVEGALQIVEAQIARFGGIFTQAFLAAGYAAAEQLASQLGENSRLAVGFDPTDPSAAARMRQNQLNFIQQFTDQQREATRAALTQALDSGRGIAATARAFRDSIGLTSYQQAAVDNYQALLEQGSVEALTRDLRDRRFDPLVDRVVNEDALLTADQIERMVERYRTNMLAMRADTIARTEILGVVNDANYEALQQTIDQTGIDPKLVVRTWNATQDARTRDTHAEMDGQERGLDEPFDSTSGAQLMYPGDDSLGAPAEEIINCRCVVTTEIKQADQPELGQTDEAA